MNAEKLKAAKIIVTHVNCPDGMASALILNDALPDAEVRFVGYGQPEREAMKAEPGMLFCDMTPPEARVKEFVDAGAIVLDHHVSSKHVVEAFGEDGFYVDIPGASGATLAMSAWKQITTCEPLSRMNDFAILAGIRDTWQRDSKHWKTACEQAAALTALPFDTFLRILQMKGWIELDRFIGQIGRGLYAKKMEAVKRAAGKLFFRYAAGHVIAYTSGTALTSDLAELLDEQNCSPDIVVGVSFEGDPEGEGVRLNYSLRSHNGFDCAAFAKAQGGGGHKAAAGFTIPGPGRSAMPFNAFEARLLDWIDWM